ncbi:uncharacterized protein BDZ99DRAFT_482727 [Mytilinidion resinicola]|uniref:Uncharacterized protein n=1 Tax=Mytilinidion resinicola TaxID=574789 RepID=A0A6A6Y1A6_9PEZI|nr:uncharacterized protein BDZ99DRAFT_482727 [Mytilinidion resinicola]KAF2802591.1 hypothetical protein BDZ99DRAFT_482727 [Mytilinidion resinicola]
MSQAQLFNITQLLCLAEPRSFIRATESPFLMVTNYQEIRGDEKIEGLYINVELLDKYATELGLTISPNVAKPSERTVDAADFLIIDGKKSLVLANEKALRRAKVDRVTRRIEYYTTNELEDFAALQKHFTEYFLNPGCELPQDLRRRTSCYALSVPQALGGGNRSTGNGAVTTGSLNPNAYLKSRLSLSLASESGMSRTSVEAQDDSDDEKKEEVANSARSRWKRLNVGYKACVKFVRSSERAQYRSWTAIQTERTLDFEEVRAPRAWQLGGFWQTVHQAPEEDAEDDWETEEEWEEDLDPESEDCVGESTGEAHEDIVDDT